MQIFCHSVYTRKASWGRRGLPETLQKMYCIKTVLFLSLLHRSCCDWISEWMAPVEDVIHQQDSATSSLKLNGIELRSFEDEDVKMVRVSHESTEHSSPNKNQNFRSQDTAIPSSTLRSRLEVTLKMAEDLVETLKDQIAATTAREKTLKDAIANGRAGVTAVTVAALGRPPHTYLVHEGVWTLCKGMIQYPVPAGNAQSSMFSDLFSTPRCIGQEVTTERDPCAFNSVIKYETIPARRRLVYQEDDYLCLRPSFNHTLERYLTVPRRVINDTCRSGVVKSIADNAQQCGIRIMSEYTYYPYRASSAAVLPLEYCTEKDGSCKLIVAWHLSNATIENFEFLQNDKNFKRFFIKSESYVDLDHVYL